jgi:glycosyltransferase involved in cell wall biosynthesis
MSRRIAMIAHTLYASDPRVRRQAEALAARGDDVTVYALRPSHDAREHPEAPTIVDDVRIRTLPQGQYRGARPLVYVLSYLLFTLLALAIVGVDHVRRRYDLVHVHNMPDLLVIGALVPRLMGAPVLLDVHDLMPELYREKFRVGANHPMIRLLRVQERLGAALASRVLTVTHPARDALVAHGIPAGKIDVVLNVPDPRRFPDLGLDARRNGAEFRIVCHGTIVERLGLDVAIRACGEASATVPGLRLDIIGAGDHLAALHRLVDEMDLGSIVTFTDALLPVDALTERLARAHAAVVPGRFDVYGSIALPTKLLEYAALGIPTLTADHVCVRHYFDETQTIFFAPDDAGALARAIVDLHADPERRASIAAAAKRFFEEYRWDTHKSLYLDTIDRLTAA